MAESPKLYYGNRSVRDRVAAAERIVGGRSGGSSSVVLGCASTVGAGGAALARGGILRLASDDRSRVAVACVSVSIQYGIGIPERVVE